MKSFFKWLLGSTPEESAYLARHKLHGLLAAGKFADAAVALRTLAEGGDAKAQFQLAQFYESGKGVVQSFPEAVRWLRPAAEKGIVAAQARLGEILLVGVRDPLDSRVRGNDEVGRHPRESGGPVSAFAQLVANAPSAKQDFSEAARWNAAAAEAGDAGAQARIGYQHASGLGVARDPRKAQKWLSAASQAGNEAGQLGLGMLLAEAGELNDPKAAANWFDKAAKQGSAAAKTCLALLYMRGQGVALDEARAAALMSEAAQAGHPPAMYYLGEIYWHGRGMARDLSAAETWLRRAGARGHVQAITACGRLLASSEGAGDYESAALLYRQAADLGDGEAQFLLGESYLAGRGVPHDTAEGARWLGKAADRGITRAVDRLTTAFADSSVATELRDATDYLLRTSAEGDANALYQLGRLHLEGAGVRRDPAAALAHFQKAAEQGSGVACLQLGILHATGEGTKQDYAQAAQWYGKAAELGVPEGRYNLAFLCLRGLGVAKDAARGRALLEQAASGGSAAAQVLLGDLLANGADLPKDLNAAAQWYERAALQGNLAAAAALTNILQTSGGPIDRVFPIWLKSALAGNALAQRIVGDFYLRGVGTARSLDDAVRWLGKAAEQGNTAAMVILGSHYAQSGVTENAKQAFALFTKAAQQGNVDAQYNLGVCYGRGLGVAADAKAAENWYRRAAEKDHAAAKAALGV